MHACCGAEGEEGALVAELYCPSFPSDMQLRALHRSCIELLLAGDPAALLQAAQEEACAERDSSAALLAAQKAAIAGAVRTLT